jgi:hypothetical protein
VGAPRTGTKQGIRARRGGLAPSNSGSVFPGPPRDEIWAAGRICKKVLPGDRHLFEDESLGGGED